jgi:Zn-dependent peptidase ImmA (M78 family)
MTEFARFGDPSRFEIAVRWTRDSETRARRPASHGWSVGDLSITIANQVITRNRRGAALQAFASWYLSPIFDWLATNWAKLLHEEDFAWTEKTGAPAVVACHLALDQWIAVSDEIGRKIYGDVQAWYRRHALRSAAEGGLFPDLFIRRFMDDIELSWSSESPLFAPDGFIFATEPGLARLAVSDVADPLWEALQWVATAPPQLDEEDRNSWRTLVEKIDHVRVATRHEFDIAYVNGDLLEKVRGALDRLGHSELMQEQLRPGRPYIPELSPAVAMFGGVTPNLGPRDVDYLCTVMADKSRGHDSEDLARLVGDRKVAPLGVPHSDGYNLAGEILEKLELPGASDWIDIRHIVGRLSIEVVEQHFDTKTIRGVALAGPNFSSTIIINTQHFFNANALGKRFTIAHELCHILFDRTRARRVTHVSGAWVAPAIEKRANAFAAYLLMPRELILRHWSNADGVQRDDVAELARKLGVNESALVEHLYNLDMIDEAEREYLRAEFRPIKTL